MVNVFISYSRKDQIAAHKLTAACKAQDLDVWIDWEGIEPTVDWWQEIERGIETADKFLFLISPDSASSEVCRREIAHAVKNGKRLIPVLVRDTRAEHVMAELRSLNWIFLRETDDFETAFGKLMIAIQSDYAWAQVHRQLQVKALEWERANHENSFLLRGIELQNAELQLATNASKEPNPTHLQREYVLSSRQSSDRQRKTISTIAVAVAISLAGLAIFGFVQAGRATANAEKEQAASTLAVSNANTAQAASTLALNNANTAEANAAETLRQYRLSRSNELAAEAISLRETDFQVSSLLAVEAWNTSDTVQARSALMENLRINPQPQVNFLGHAGAVCCATFSPDGALMASASEDGTILIWDLETYGPFVEPLRQHSAITSIAFSPDGKLLASGSADKSILLWDVRTGAPRGKPLVGHTGPVARVMFTQEGRVLASWGLDRRIVLWDVETAKAIDIRQLTRDVRDVALSPDGQILATATETAITFWDMQTSQPLGPPLQNGTTYTRVAFSPDGRILASGSEEGTVTFWQVDQQKEFHTSITGSPDSVTSMEFDVDGTTLITSREEGEIILHHTNYLDRKLGLIPGGVTSVAISPDGKTIAANQKNKIILWDIEQDELITRKLGRTNNDLNSVGFSADGQMLATGYFTSDTRLWDLTVDSPVGSVLAGGPDGGVMVRFSEGGKLLGLNSMVGYGYVHLWDVRTKRSMALPLEGYQVINFSPDGKILVLRSYIDGTQLLWDLDRGKQVGPPLDGYDSVPLIDAKRVVLQSQEELVMLDRATWTPIHIPLRGQSLLAISADCKFLALKDPDGNLQLWNVGAQQPVGQPFHDYVYWISDTAFSPDGKVFASSVDYGTIYLWDVSTGELLGPPLRADNGIVPNLTFSPDGKYLAAGATIKTILWDIQTRRPLGQPLDGSNFGLTPGSQAFSPDGKWFATINPQTQTVVLWDLDPASWKEKTCRRVGRNLTLDEWIRYFPDKEYRPTCPQWPSQPELISTPQPAG